MKRFRGLDRKDAKAPADREDLIRRRVLTAEEGQAKETS